jgi:hypothetical protein
MKYLIFLLLFFSTFAVAADQTFTNRSGYTTWEVLNASNGNTAITNATCNLTVFNSDNTTLFYNYPNAFFMDATYRAQINNSWPNGNFLLQPNCTYNGLSATMIYTIEINEGEIMNIEALVFVGIAFLFAYLYVNAHKNRVTQN